MKVVRPAGQTCLFLCLLAGVAVKAESFDPQAIDSLVRHTLRLWGVPGAAVIITDADHVLYVNGFGVKDLRSHQPVTPNTRFAIGSATKAFTSTAMAMLVDEGKVDWDDPVRRHLDYFHLADPVADREVTLRDILSHRTGLSRHDLLWYGAPWSREEIIRRIGKVPLTRPFRSAYQYQNIMFLAAGEALAHAAGTSWDEFVWRRIFVPLGMTDTDTSTAVAAASQDHATPHQRQADGTTVPIAWRNMDNIAPAGGINSSVRDLGRWMRLHLNGGVFEGARLVSRDALRETYTRQTPIRLSEHLRMLTDRMTQINYGMGWFINDYRGHQVLSHAGAIDGFRSNVTLLPEDKIGIAVLTNLGQLNVPEALRDGIVEIVLGLKPVDWNNRYLAAALKEEAEDAANARVQDSKELEGGKPSTNLGAYAGVYHEPAYGTATITLEGDSLFLSWSSFKTRLGHRYFDAFRAESEDLARAFTIFHVGRGGDVDGFQMFGMDFRRIPELTLAPGGKRAIRIDKKGGDRGL